jgi:hypothetical protein
MQIFGKSVWQFALGLSQLGQELTEDITAEVVLLSSDLY